VLPGDVPSSRGSSLWIGMTSVWVRAADVDVYDTHPSASSGALGSS
jgi:hypothetical protein